MDRNEWENRWNRSFNKL